VKFQHATIFIILTGLTTAAGAGGGLLHTLTSPDGVFVVSYHDPLVACRKTAQAWEPVESCVAPICGESDMVCITYPHDAFPDSDLVSATFSLRAVPEEHDASACLKQWTRRDYPTPTSRKIAGVIFKAIHRDGVASGVAADTYEYRAFHNGTCYELHVSTAYVNPEMADPGVIKPLPQSVRRKIDASLDQTLNSFRFLK
jgi:hypothetical protein